MISMFIRDAKIVGHVLLMVDLTVEESNRLFETLQDWGQHLASFDLDDLRCDDEHLR